MLWTDFIFHSSGYWLLNTGTWFSLSLGFVVLITSSQSWSLVGALILTLHLIKIGVRKYTNSVTVSLSCAVKWLPAVHILLWNSAVFWAKSELWVTTEQHESQHSTSRRLSQWIQHHQCQTELHSFCTVCSNYSLWRRNYKYRTGRKIMVSGYSFCKCVVNYFRNGWEYQ